MLGENPVSLHQPLGLGFGVYFCFAHKDPWEARAEHLGCFCIPGEKQTPLGTQQIFYWCLRHWRRSSALNWGYSVGNFWGNSVLWEGQGGSPSLSWCWVLRFWCWAWLRGKHQGTQRVWRDATNPLWKAGFDICRCQHCCSFSLSKSNSCPAFIAQVWLSFRVSGPISQPVVDKSSCVADPAKLHLSPKLCFPHLFWLLHLFLKVYQQTAPGSDLPAGQHSPPASITLV